MRFDIFTLFPDFFTSPLQSSILARAQNNRVLEVCAHDIRAWTHDKHHVCDDAPFGGGAGMVMKAEPVAAAIEDVLKWDAVSQSGAPPYPVVLMSPQGRPFTQKIAQELSAHSRIALLCGHYEGIDERAIEMLVTDEISVGDYVLTGGEVAALVVIDAVARLAPGVLGNEASHQHDSFSDGILEAPQYTRPSMWREREIPPVLLSGNHAEIAKWRRREGLRRTMQRRPDLIELWIEGAPLSKDDEKTIAQLRRENNQKSDIEYSKTEQLPVETREVRAGENDESEFN